MTDEAVKAVAEAFSPGTYVWLDTEGQRRAEFDRDEIAHYALRALRAAINEGRVSPEELGMELIGSYAYPSRRVCPLCRGDGGDVEDSTKPCDECHGTGNAPGPTTRTYVVPVPSDQ